MFEGKRLEYVVPGYTGHIPQKGNDEAILTENKQPRSHIPGYGGFVHSIKSENLFASTFGKVTNDVNSNNYEKGQELKPKSKYVSVQTTTNIVPSEMLSRTAANIVGIPNKEIKVKEPKLQEHSGCEVNQFKLVKEEKWKQEMRNKSNKMQNNRVVEMEGKEYVKLNQPLPGYTGFGKRVMANNIFGKSFAQCRNDSLRDADTLDRERKKNFMNQLEEDIGKRF